MVNYTPNTSLELFYVVLKIWFYVCAQKMFDVSYEVTQGALILNTANKTFLTRDDQHGKGRRNSKKANDFN